MRLLIHERAFGRIEASLAALSPEVVPLRFTDEGQILLAGESINPDGAQPDIVWANADAFFSPAVRTFMKAALKSPGLRWVQSGAAGFDNPVFGQFIQKGARLTTSHGQAVGMADYVLWGVLDALQGGPERRAAQAAAAWTRNVFREIEGLRWTIFGFGAIGQGVAVRARAFGGHITAIRRNTAPDPAADRMATRADFLDLLPTTDVLVLSAPLTPDTRHVADAAAFRRMKPGSIFVNVGRGPLVDEPALLSALDQGAPAHAVLDVFETEPLPADSPFWHHPRVTLTPHSSGMSVGNAARNDVLFLDNLGRFLAGQPLANEAAAADVLAD